ncbi:MAG TPA: zinc-binding dehydrogenase [Chitinophagales bacterium]|nr:zinc-binding dehydrogenase [Chitinophagales bacterium]HRK27811.1 zinc-binding dehydrogenase [Chitinophagales bacterium]
MHAAVLIKNGNAQTAFEIRNLPNPVCKPDEVRIQVQAFGLNFADVMARLGKYRDCPPLPAVIGYEVVGYVAETGSQVKNLQIGQRVVAFTRFGGYATQVTAPAIAAVPIPDNWGLAEATALATQYCTAYFAACIATNLHPSDHVLIHAAAGGVGIALTQLAKHKGCTIYGTAGSDAKLQLLRKQGVDFPINYQTQDFTQIIKKQAPNGKIDAVFDSIGGSYVKKGIALLNAGGRMVCFGAANMSGAGLLGTIIKAWQFGFYHPAAFMMRSAGLIGVNMLRIADHKPQLLQLAMQEVVNGVQAGFLQPVSGGVFPVADLAKAHTLLQNRQTTGKIAVAW